MGQNVSHQGSQGKGNKSDKVIAFRTHGPDTVEDTARFIEKQGLTVDRIATITHSPKGQVIMTYSDGPLTVEGKGRISMTKYAGVQFMSSVLVKSAGLHFFENSPPDQSVDQEPTSRLLGLLASLKDARGRHAAELYCAGYVVGQHKPNVQRVKMPDGKIIKIDGLTSVRHDAVNNRLVAIALPVKDYKDRTVVTFDLDTYKDRPEACLDSTNWAVRLTASKPGMVSLTRVKSDGIITKGFANYADGQSQEFSISTDQQKAATWWGALIETPYVLIGWPTGRQGVSVGFRSDPQNVEIEISVKPLSRQFAQSPALATFVS